MSGVYDPPYPIPQGPKDDSNNNNAALTAPLELPAVPGKPLTTQGGNTLDDGTGKAQFLGGASTFPDGTADPGQLGLGDTPTLFLKAGGYFLGIPESVVIMSGSGPALSIRDTSLPDFTSTPGYNSVGVLDIFGNFIGGNVAGTGYVQPNGAAKLNSGTGAPTIAGSVGDYFFRTDTPTTADQRIYVCTTAGAAGAAVWTGIL